MTTESTTDVTGDPPVRSSAWLGDGNISICPRCGHYNGNGKRRRRFYMMEEYPGRFICGTCVGKVRLGAKAT